jgi:cytochrome c oxidase subunit 4
MNRESLGHVVPARTIIGVWAALVLLAAVSYGSYAARLGEFEVITTMGVACAKVALVFYFFMHLGYEGRGVRVLFLLLVFILLLVFGLTWLDIGYR